MIVRIMEARKFDQSTPQYSKFSSIDTLNTNNLCLRHLKTRDVIIGHMAVQDFDRSLLKNLRICLLKKNCSFGTQTTIMQSFDTWMLMNSIIRQLNSWNHYYSTLERPKIWLFNSWKIFVLRILLNLKILMKFDF